RDPHQPWRRALHHQARRAHRADGDRDARDRKLAGERGAVLDRPRRGGIWVHRHKALMDFTESQIQRYARHILLKEVGGVGQEKLLTSKVLVIGAGGLGSPLVLYLAAAGVGTIGVIDDDAVDL